MHWEFAECLSSRSFMKNVDETCGEGQYFNVLLGRLIFSCFILNELKCFKYCFGDSPVTHKTLLFIFVSQNLNAIQMFRS